MEEKQDNPRSPETMRPVDKMLIFDVDGTLTDPRRKIITEPEILDEIIKELEKDEPVALNTGRSIEWIKDRVLNSLAKRIKDKAKLQNLLIVAEQGGTWAEFDEQNNLIESKDHNISVPDSLKKQIRDLVNKKYSDSMFFDESKLTMISTEMKDGHSLEDYQEKQIALSAELKKLLEDSNLADKFKVDPTTIATDIENKHVGKDFAVKRIIEWVKKKGISPQRYIAFGDSLSDLPMAQELNLQSLPVEFVYVGSGNINTSGFLFPIHQTQAKFGKGTLEFLKTL